MSDTTAMTAVKLPVDCIDFLRRNPKLAEAAGSLMVALIEINSIKKQLTAKVQDNSLATLVENGTEQEYQKFISYMLAAYEDATSIGNMPPQAFEELQKKMGEHMLATNIPKEAVIQAVGKEVSA